MCNNTCTYLMKVEGLLLCCFLYSMIPPGIRALDLNEVCVTHEAIGGGTQNATATQPQTRPFHLIQMKGHIGNKQEVLCF